MSRFPRLCLILIFLSPPLRGPPGPASPAARPSGPAPADPALPDGRGDSPQRRAAALGSGGQLGLRPLSAPYCLGSETSRPLRTGCSASCGARCVVNCICCQGGSEVALKRLREKCWRGDGGIPPLLWRSSRGSLHAVDAAACSCWSVLPFCVTVGVEGTLLLPQRPPTPPLQDVKTLNFFFHSSVSGLGTIESKL